MLFNYQAKDDRGSLKKGVVEAATTSAATDVLHANGLVVLQLSSQGEGINLERYLSFLNRVSKKDLVVFSRQLSTLINAKVPIVQALEVMVDQVSSKRLKGIIEELIEQVVGGKSLSEAMSTFPDVFPELYLHLVASGEMSGTVDRALNYIADQQEKDYDLTAKIRGALAYPAFIVAAITIVGGIMFVFVLPQMITVLEEAGVELPITTKILIFATKVVSGYWYLLIGGVIAAIFGFRVYVRTIGGRLVWDTLKMKVPVFGKLLMNIYMDRFSLNLASLVAGGIPIVQSLRTVAAIITNMVYRQIILEAALQVEQGKSIASVLADRPEFPKLVSQMIKIGEQTGSLEEILTKISRFYDKELNNTLNTLTTLLEPFVMILLGLAVAIMVAGILLPIYNLAGAQ
ncbi:MAG: Type IV pilus inner membrane protein PilC [Parcubacteria group bacterium GW2011_GWA2_51_12]|nr:MAG: Type IV pilus inner membrane protein PilC [Parcubacteria group bacterium GW2011_GWA2_51_12]